MKMIDVLETVFSGKDFKKGQKVTTPMGDGVIQSIYDEDKKEKNRTLTGHLGNDKRVMKRADVKLSDGTVKSFSLFQLS